MDFPVPSLEPEDPVLPDHVIIDIPKSQRRRLYLVWDKMRRDKKRSYWPVAVFLGLNKYDSLTLPNPFKDELRDMLCGSADRKSSLLSNIYERIDDIRYFYGRVRHDDDEEDKKRFAEVMLRDACFLICFMLGFGKHGLKTYIQMCERMGMSDMLFASSDICMLENQIPLWLISLIYPHHQSLLCEYLSYRVYGNYSMKQFPWKEGEEPLHLIEALHRTFLRVVDTQQNSSLFRRVFNKDNQPREISKKITRNAWTQMDSLFRSVTDLKAKGIYLQRSSNCLTDINFFSFGLFAQLHLPIFWVSTESKVLFSELIAFEMSPGTDTDFGVTSYINFMKTLINNANDVKMMRKKGILCSTLENDEEVLDIFKSISTYGFSSTGLGQFNEVKMRIDEYCNNKARIWMAELINTYFRSPWSVIALLATAFLLCLTFLQTYYTINPRS